MLKFLENRPEDRSPKRSPIKFKPQMCYGNSYQSPNEFQTPNTVYYASSYINPFLKFQERRAKCIERNRKNALEPLWTRKTNLSLVEEHKILANPEQSPPKSRYLQSFHQQFTQDPKRFNITRGQCSNFIQKNNHYKPMGPMQGIQRTNQRIKSRQQSVWIKSPSKRSQMTQSLSYATSLNTTVKSSIGQNSQMLTQKIRIRRNREHIRKTFWKQLNQRKKLTTSIRFKINKNDPEHQLYLVDKGLMTRYASNSLSKQQQNVSQELEHFENKLNRIFK